MENSQKQNKEALSQEDADHINSIIKPIFNKYLPQETSSNSMTTPILRVKKLFRPNNYRRWCGFKIVDDSAFRCNLGTMANVSRGSHNKLITIRNFQGKGVTVQIGKDKVVGIYNQLLAVGRKYWFVVERNSTREVNDAINDKKDEIGLLVDSVVRDVCKSLGLVLEGSFGWLRAESSIKNDDFLDNLPKDLVIYDSVFKKVYSDDVEFVTGKGKDPLVYVKNYITNKALADLSPELVSSLNGLGVDFNKALDRLSLEALVPLTDQIRLHLDVLKRMQENQVEMNGLLKGLKGGVVTDSVSLLGRLKSNICVFPDDLLLYAGFVKRLSVLEKDDLMAWCFERFGKC